MRDNPTDLDFEKLKIGTEPKSVEFSDLIADVLDVIIGNLELKERLVLRKVSRGLRTLIDEKKSILETIGIVCNLTHVCVRYNDHRVVYAIPSVSFTRVEHLKRYYQAKYIQTEDYVKVAVDDLISALKIPKLQLNSLELEYYSKKAYKFQLKSINEFAKKFRASLTSLNPQISTKKLKIVPVFGTRILAILPHLKPGTLECIEIKNNEISTFWVVSSEVDQITSLAQWKQAKELRLKEADEIWPKSALTHFETISISKKDKYLTELLEWRDFFSRSANFKSCRFAGSIPASSLDRFGNIVSSEIGDENPIHIIHHPIMTGSNQILEIKVKPKIIFFTKIARPSL